MDVNSNGGRRRGPATANAGRRRLVSESPGLLCTAFLFCLVTTLGVPAAPAGAGMEREAQSSKSGALPRPLCLLALLSQSSPAQGAKPGLEGRGVSSSCWVSVRPSPFIRRFPNCWRRVASGLGLAGIPGPGSQNRLVRKEDSRMQISGTGIPFEEKTT